MRGMKRMRPWLGWLLTWCLVVGSGVAWIADAHLQNLRNQFDTDARIAHRLLSQRLVQHDAILGTLTQLQPSLTLSASANAVSSGLGRLYPQVLAVAQRTELRPWPADWPLASALPPASGQAYMVDALLPEGQLFIVQAAYPASYALHLDLRAAIPHNEWPYSEERSPERIWLTHGAHSLLLQPGAAAAAGWQWSTSKTLASPSQPLELHIQRQLDASMLPWVAMLGWTLGCSFLLLALRAAWQQRIARQRAEQLLQHGQVARLNTLGELAAGMAHELNQPLTAILSNSQAARRLLDDGDATAARQAMGQAAEQAKRASAVVGRLRRLVERPDLSAHTCAVPVAHAVSEALHLLEPELHKRQIQLQRDIPPHLPSTQVEPVALQQILHNLLLNAMQAMDSLAHEQRLLRIACRQQGQNLHLTVQDSGPGIAAGMRERLFTPFATTRGQGLGLGLTLSESLAESMGGRLRLISQPTLRGACFELTLPLSVSSAATH